MSTQPVSATPALQFTRTPDRLLNSREVAAWLGVSLDWEYVRWLDVPVDNSFSVRRIERVSNLNTQIEHGFNFQRSAIDQVTKRLSLQQFHRDESSAINFIDFVDRADVRMIQRGSRTGFAPEPGLVVLLCYKKGVPQKGQPESCRSRTLAIVCRRVAIDQGLCRSTRTG